MLQTDKFRIHIFEEGCPDVAGKKDVLATLHPGVYRGAQDRQAAGNWVIQLLLLKKAEGKLFPRPLAFLKTVVNALKNRSELDIFSLLLHEQKLMFSLGLKIK